MGSCREGTWLRCCPRVAGGRGQGYVAVPLTIPLHPGRTLHSAKLKLNPLFLGGTRLPATAYYYHTFGTSRKDVVTSGEGVCGRTAGPIMPGLVLSLPGVAGVTKVNVTLGSLKRHTGGRPSRTEEVGRRHGPPRQWTGRGAPTMCQQGPGGCVGAYRPRSKRHTSPRPFPMP